MLTGYATTKEILVGNCMRLCSVRDFIHIIKLYKSRFQDPISILLKNKRRNYPIKVKLCNSEVKAINNFGELLSHLYDFEYDSENDILSLKKIGYPIKLYSGINNGETIGIFYKKDYEFLIDKSRDIVDIGANIADSSIYFALEGARRIIAIEPFLKNYEIANHNILINNLSSKITLLHAACASKDGKIFTDSSYEGVFKPHTGSAQIVKIDCLTLKHILSQYKLESPALKIDCEGCEYDLILQSDPRIIQEFSAIQIEYHYGCELLKRRLLDLGFSVRSTKPRYRYNKYATNKKMYVGWLFAENMKKSGARK